VGGIDLGGVPGAAEHTAVWAARCWCSAALGAASPQRWVEHVGGTWITLSAVSALAGGTAV
jgi:hypothetical protein